MFINHFILQFFSRILFPMRQIRRQPPCWCNQVSTFFENPSALKYTGQTK
jgi:hypothetical protein